MFYTFIHDGSGQLINTSVVFTLGSVTEGPIIQHFKVDFIEVGSYMVLVCVHECLVYRIPPLFCCS